MKVIKVRHSEKATKFENNLPLVLRLLCKCQLGDFFKFCGLLKKTELYYCEGRLNGIIYKPIVIALYAIAWRPLPCLQTILTILMIIDLNPS